MLGRLGCKRYRVVVGLLAVATAAIAFGPSSADAQEADLVAAKRKANAVAAALSDAESQLGRIDEDLANVVVRKADAESRVASLDAAVKEALVQQLIHSDVTAMASALGNDPTDQLRARVLGEVATRSGTDAIEQYVAALGELNEAESSLMVLHADAAKATEELRSKRSQVENELARLQRATAATATNGKAPSGPIASGDWVCPVQGPVAFTDSWGAPRSGGRSHKGVDMLSPRGTPTVAPVAGRVVHKESGLGGLTWYVYGDDGNTYYGAHLSSYANQGVGRVQAGTVIGYIGDTGNAKGTNHLHFQIQPGGREAVNPYPTVARYC